MPRGSLSFAGRLAPAGSVSDRPGAAGGQKAKRAESLVRRNSALNLLYIHVYNKLIIQ